MSSRAQFTDRTADRSESGGLLQLQAVLRRKVGTSGIAGLGPVAREAIGLIDGVIARNVSTGVLFWPKRPDGIAIFHALACLDRIQTCDLNGFSTLYFPWSQNVGATQRTLLVDRDALVGSTIAALGRVYAARGNASYSFLMSLHSLKHIGRSGKSEKMLKRAVERDPLLVHPAIFEITPQIGITAGGVRDYRDQFLRRLRRHTWINDCPDHLEAVGAPEKTPFFMFGVHADALDGALLRKGGLDPKSGGRRPDVIMLDVTRRARNRIGGGSWRQKAVKFCNIVSDLYGSAAPPILALTDDVFVTQALRWEILKQYDVGRGAVAEHKGPAPARVVLTASSDLLSQVVIQPVPPPKITAEAYGGEILSFSDFGLTLRRKFIDAGDEELAGAVADGMHAIQNLIGLPGYPRQLMQFANDNYERFECQTILARYDRLLPRGKIKAALQTGQAGANHNQLTEFLAAMDKLFAAADTNNPGCQLFDKCLLSLVQNEGRSLLVFSSELLRGFAEWRIEEDAGLSDVRAHLGSKILLVDKREAAEALDIEDGAEAFQRIVFMEPGAEDLLGLLTHPKLSPHLVVLAHLARVEHVLRRIRILLDLDGTEPVRERLKAVATEFTSVLAGRRIDLPDLDAAPPLPRLGTLDLTAGVGAGAGRTRILLTSGGFKIRAFDRSEFALYNPDALQIFIRRDASQLQLGDQICVFTPDFVESARDKLNLAANASDVLLLYHKDVVAAAARLPGPDLQSQAQALRNRMLGIDPALDLPGLQSLKSWIDVEHLIKAARNTVRPQAPRVRRHYVCLMKALGISDDVARLYWDLGVFWTRSMRIRTGAAFHQVFMGILIDPLGTTAHLPAERRQDIWHIYETAEHHVVTVIGNEREAAEQS